MGRAPFACPERAAFRSRRRACAAAYSGSAFSYNSGMKLSELSVNRSGAVLAVHLPPALAARLNMLNVRPGAQVRMLRTAPFSGGFMLDAGGVHIALRRSVAEQIEVSPLAARGGAPAAPLKTESANTAAPALSAEEKREKLRAKKGGACLHGKGKKRGAAGKPNKKVSKKGEQIHPVQRAHGRARKDGQLARRHGRRRFRPRRS